MYDILQTKSQPLKQQLVALTRQLIETPSPTCHEEKVAALVETTMKDLGYDNVFIDEAGNVVGILYGRENDPTLLLNCHMDTAASAAPHEAWSKPLFDAVEEDGKLFGLGAADCKGGLAAQILAAQLIKRSILPIRGHLIVAATVGEEQGGSVGVRHLIEQTLPQLGLSPDYAILGEPTNLGLYYGHDGWMEMTINVEGPDMLNVNDAARAIFHDFAQSANTHDQRQQHIANPPHYSRHGSFSSATIDLNCRVNEDLHEQDILQRIEHQASLVAHASGGVAVKAAVRETPCKLYNGRSTVIRHITHAWEIDPFHPLMERSRLALQAAGCSVRPGKWQLGRLGMGTAGGTLYKQYGIPTIGYGPGNEDVIHAPDEYITLDNLHRALYGTAVMIHELIGLPVYGWSSDQP